MHSARFSHARVPGVFIFRVDGALLYFNVDYIRERFFELFAARGDKIDLVILDLGTVTAIDLAGVDLLIHLRHSLLRRDIQLRLAETHTTVRHALERSGFVNRYGRIEPDLNVDVVLERWQAESGT